MERGAVLEEEADLEVVSLVRLCDLASFNFAGSAALGVVGDQGDRSADVEEGAGNQDPHRADARLRQLIAGNAAKLGRWLAFLATSDCGRGVCAKRNSVAARWKRLESKPTPQIGGGSGLGGEEGPRGGRE